MAVCGRCLLCGYKFNGRLDDDTEPDVATRWECNCTNADCEGSRKYFRENYNEVKTHAICRPCVDQLVNGTLSGVVSDLVTLVAKRHGY